ncbi:hypothetical protein EV191_11958 [Tamaricihabitans halophyticus]|uniref:Amine oxidase domain-containing protein n=1 Tax=Tamaricihabitans halophyticus TaxID=1262583 RepID=A0A4R2Q794_9PSEU|nr:FAD-dependent oxidoreductase [Tamaricihabitans halophyticus]TCP44773.1 hypothetical protein EV191_11958 [Tamaricihabitans halophyticus]
MTRDRVAVIGSGVSGLSAAYLLQRRYDVTLFEAAERLGGHAHTHELPTADASSIAVDSAFLVHNDRTYPNLLRLFDELGIETQPTRMSLSVYCEQCRLQYAGARGLSGLFAQRRNVGHGRYLRMLGQIPRFHRQARQLLAADSTTEDLTFGDFLRAGGYSNYFVEHFALPLVSAVWSAERELCKNYPARYLFEFLDRHGQLSIRNTLTWRTIVGGSREYVARVAKQLHVVRTGVPVTEVRRLANGVSVRTATGESAQFSRAVVATHADTALGLLAEPSPEQRTVLGAFGYSNNVTWLHTDSSLLPSLPAARGAWNYLKPACAAGPDRVLVSYHLNRLMRLAEPRDYIVTLGATDRVQPDQVLVRMVYRHPIYTRQSVRAQRRLWELGDERLQFAGAYHGWGFHEDGCVSGVRAATALGSGW